MEPLPLPKNARSVALLALAALAIAFAAIGLDWGLPSTRAPEIDGLLLDGGWAYSGVDLMKEGGSKYPPLCYLAMELVFAPLRRMAGPGADPAEVAPRFIVAGRATTAALALAAAAGVFAIGRRAGGTAAGVLAALLFLTNPTVVYYARTTNADLPYVAWYVLSVAVAIRLVDRRGRPRGEASAFWLLAAASLATKDQAVGLFPLLAAWVLWRLREPGSRAGFLAASLVGLATYALAWVPVGGWARFVLHVRATTGRSADFRTHDLSPGSQLALAVEVARDLASAAGPVLLVLGLFGLWRLARGRGRTAAIALALGWPTYMLLLLVFARQVYVRFLLPFVPCLAVAAGAMLAGLLRSPGRLRGLGALAVAAVLLHAGAGAWGMIRWLEAEPVPRSRAFLAAALDRGELAIGSRVGVFAVEPAVVFEQDEHGGHRSRPAWRDWSEENYGQVDPRLPLVPMPWRVTALYLALPAEVALLDPPSADVAAWHGPLAAGELGYAPLARFEREGWFDGSHLRPRREVVLLEATDPAAAEALLLLEAARETRDRDAARETLELLPAACHDDPEVLRRFHALLDAIASRP